MDFVDAEAVSIFLTPKIMLPPLFPSSPDSYLTSMQITDDHGRPATDYVNTCWKGQPENFIVCPYAL